MNCKQNEKINQVKESTLVVGIDIGSTTQYARAFDWRGIELGKVFKFSNSREGFENFKSWMQWLQDNDIKYRYILMKGKADGSSLDLLETKFSRERDNDFIRSLTDSVKGFEYRSRKQAEALERARLLNEQAEQLREQADKLGKP